MAKVPVLASKAPLGWVWLGKKSSIWSHMSICVCVYIFMFVYIPICRQVFSKTEN